MAITSKVRPSYAWRMIILAVLCLVFGLWGAYDYWVAIPRQEVQYQRFQVLEETRNALEATPGTPDYRDRQQSAETAIRAELLPLIETMSAGADVTAVAVDDPQHPGWIAMLLINSADRVSESEQNVGELNERAKAVIAHAKTHEDFVWFRGLLMSAVAVDELERRPRPAEAPLAGVPLMAYNYVTEQIEDMGGAPTKPSKFDRITQWAFILCLPCAPYFLLLYRRARAKTYRLEDDGSLVTPEGTWAADDIKDIDMGRWMSKSIATVSTADGKEVKLDDYLFKGMHLIVGAIAHTRYPDVWDENAKTGPERRRRGRRGRGARSAAAGGGVGHPRFGHDRSGGPGVKLRAPRPE